MRKIISILIGLVLLVGCSSTSNLEPGEQLYTGLEKIDWQNYESCEHKDVTQAEVEAALAIAPNGALFGSSYYRTPFPYGLWIWNAWHDSKGVVAKWLCNSFGKQPVLMQNVNVPLRASVANSVLANHGYFHGNVTYDIIDAEPTTNKKDTVMRSRSAKVQYHVNYGPLFTLDTITYSNFPAEAQKYMMQTTSLLQPGDPFSVSTLDNERTRIYNLFRNKGYYYYQKGYISYLADTLQTPGKVHVQMHLADSLDEDVMRRWVIGTTTLNLRRTMLEQLDDSVHRKHLFINFGGRKSPVRARVLLQQLKLRPGSIFSQDLYQESLNNLSSQGIYSSIDIAFAKRLNEDGTTHLVPDSIRTLRGESRAGAGVLDMTVNAVLDKPWSITVGAKAMGKTNNRFGPGLDITLAKKNAFRGGEMLSVSAGANYEFQVSGDGYTGNSYDFTLSSTLQFPRLLLPSLTKKRHRWYTTPSTQVTLSAESQHRAGFFTRNVFSGELTYIWQPSQCSVHKWTPLGITYGRTSNTTSEFQKKTKSSMMSYVANLPEFTPRMRYTYTYSSPSSYRHPIYIQATVQEAGMLTALGFTAFGRGWNEKDKEILGVPFSQYLKFEADFRKTWMVTDNASLVLHFYGGYLRPLGNDTSGPFSEQLYVGGANDMRGFTMRSIGPGNLHFSNTQAQFGLQNGDLKMVFNAEYRPKLFGSLYGALFMDVGNVWYINHDTRKAYREKAAGIETASKDVGIDVGVGIRYDLDYFVVRLDWGFAIHRPYTDTVTIDDNDNYVLTRTNGGFFNGGTFKQMQVLNFAIGYPF